VANIELAVAILFPGNKLPIKLKAAGSHIDEAAPNINLFTANNPKESTSPENTFVKLHTRHAIASIFPLSCFFIIYPNSTPQTEKLKENPVPDIKPYQLESPG
jgi:hypothetical protein